MVVNYPGIRKLPHECTTAGNMQTAHDESLSSSSVPFYLSITLGRENEGNVAQMSMGHSFEHTIERLLYIKNSSLTAYPRT